MPSPAVDVMDTTSQYSSCETLDSHQSSESEVNGNDGERPKRKISVEHSDYIQKERVTKAVPPKPAVNPMQFVAIKPSNLFQTAQEQLKKAEEVRKAKEINRKEEPEDWQNNLDNWKSSRRKRVEKIIERVVEVKKLEEEEHDRNRRKSKTFNELMEERGSRRKLSTLPVYAEEDAFIDLTGLSESTVSDVNDSSDKSKINSDNRVDDKDKAQQEEKKAADDVFNNNFHSTALIKDVIHKKPATTAWKMQAVSEVEKRETTETFTMSTSGKPSVTKTIKLSFDSRERDSYDDAIEDYKSRVSKSVRLDLPKVDITKRRELFEKEVKDDVTSNVAAKTIDSKLGSETISIKDRISSLRSNLATTTVSAPPPKKPLDFQFKNVQHARNEIELKQQTMENHKCKLSVNDDNESLESTDREDSGVQTTDVSCAVSQADDQLDDEHQVVHKTIQISSVNENVASEVCKEADFNTPAASEETEIDDESSVIEEALDMAFQIIDNEKVDSMPNGDEVVTSKSVEAIYENVDENSMREPEPHYQVPRLRNTHYEIPKKTVPIPLYENVELMFPTPSVSSRFSMADSNESFGVDDGTEMVFPIDQSKYLVMEPPKEKPPPLPFQENPGNQSEMDNFRRINSTKRIKKEIRNKRSSFLGIEGQEFDDFALELAIAPPPDMQALLQEEKRLEKQLHQKNGLYQNSDNGGSRDSGLSDNHSRRSSEPSSTSSEIEQTLGEMSSSMLLSEQHRNFSSYMVNEDDTRIKTLEDQISKQEKYSNFRPHRDHQEVLRVEKLLLQIEQQELKRQRENLVMRKNLARRELDEGVKLLMINDASSVSLQNLSEVSTFINGNSHYENVDQKQQPTTYQTNCHRKSMPNLQDFSKIWPNCGTSTFQSSTEAMSSHYSGDMMTPSSKSDIHLNQNHFLPKPYQPPAPTTHHHHHHHNSGAYSNTMTRHALMQISAVPKPKLTNDWVQFRKSEPAAKPSINSHWLIQEAEQRRIEQLNNVRTSAANKPLPESVIQTLTQRVQNMGLGVNVNKRYTIFDSKQMLPTSSSSSMQNPLSPTQMDVLSVSSKKLCSYCTFELGSGAAMIIENLGLFYHIDCFKCSVCHTPISDGNIHGTDVRVRNSRLHCQNCFSNEEGVKFSCV